MAASTSSGGDTAAPMPTSNNVNPIAVKQIIVSIVLPIIALIATGMRFWARRMMRVTPAVEDWLVVAGFIFTVGYAVVNILLVTLGGVGWSSTALIEAGQLARVTSQIKLTLAGQAVYALGMGCIKASICLQLIRLFWVEKVFRYLGIIVFALSVGWAIQTMLIGFLICRPLSHNWDTASPGTCGNLRAAYISVGIVDAITDGMIFVLPIPVIRGLKMPTRTKVATCSIFALGLVTIVAGIIRTIQVSHLQFDPSDVAAEVDLCMWSVVEPCVGITVTCMIVMRPLFLRFGERFLSWAPWTTRRSGQGKSYDSSKLANTDHSINYNNHQFVKLGPRSNAILLNSMASRGDEYSATNFASREDHDVSDHYNYPGVPPSNRNQSPVHVV